VCFQDSLKYTAKNNHIFQIHYLKTFINIIMLFFHYFMFFKDVLVRVYFILINYARYIFFFFSSGS